jgi:hypothetical protein
MSNLNFLLTYVQSCLGGKLGPSDCGPVWHLLIIVTLIVLMAGTLAVLRLRARGQTGAAA